VKKKRAGQCKRERRYRQWRRERSCGIYASQPRTTMPSTPRVTPPSNHTRRKRRGALCGSRRKRVRKAGKPCAAGARAARATHKACLALRYVRQKTARHASERRATASPRVIRDADAAPRPRHARAAASRPGIVATTQTRRATQRRRRVSRHQSDCRPVCAQHHSPDVRQRRRCCR